LGATSTANRNASAIPMAGQPTRVGDSQVDAPADGEVPVPQPTILQQVAGYDGDPDAVGIILLNGGINDFDVRFILKPLTARRERRPRVF